MEGTVTGCGYCFALLIKVTKACSDHCHYHCRATSYMLDRRVKVVLGEMDVTQVRYPDYEIAY